MLTDSGDNYAHVTVPNLTAIMQEEAQLPTDEQLTVHMFGFGQGVNEAFIEQLANIGNGSHFTCQTGGDMDRVNLVRAFTRLASQPAVKVSLMQEIRAGSAAKYKCES
jgi:secreted protein with Ig-like and vWFA domain